MIADIVLELLSYVAQTEREFIRLRQAEGIAIAKDKGIHFGRKPMDKPENYERVKNRWLEGKYPQDQQEMNSVSITRRSSDGQEEIE